MSVNHSVVVLNRPIFRGVTGSWTKMLEYMFFQYKCKNVDIFQTGDENKDIGIYKVKKSLLTKIPYFRNKKNIKYSFIAQIIEKYKIINFIDDINLLMYVDSYLKGQGIREQYYLNFFFHGYSLNTNAVKAQNIYEACDKWVYLTDEAYRYDLDKYTTMPCSVSILENGIDKNRFNLESTDCVLWPKTSKYKFLWLSANRKKKGVNILIKLWPFIKLKYPEAHCIVVGVSRDEKIDGLDFHGYIPNEEVHKYYKSCDFYLFPTLFKEGFPLSLSEAMCCGAIPISSTLGGSSTTLGNFGYKVNEPHIIDNWLSTIDKAIIDFSNNNLTNPSAKHQYDSFICLDEWCEKFEQECLS